MERLSMRMAKTRDGRASHASILAAALIEHDGQGRFISYSRSSDLWASGFFEGTTYSKRRVVPFIDTLSHGTGKTSFGKTRRPR